MKMSTDGLGGVWSGRFWFDANTQKSVPFSAWITVSSDRVSGSTLERNTFVKNDRCELDASIRGHLSENEIVFLKAYKSVDQEPVYYEGEISDDGRSILGRWYFDWPDEKSGVFEMSREPIKQKVAPYVEEKA